MASSSLVRKGGGKSPRARAERGAHRKERLQSGGKLAQLNHTLRNCRSAFIFTILSALRWTIGICRQAECAQHLLDEELAVRECVQLCAHSSANCVGWHEVTDST
eukprot:scaffold257999_cov32-Tisochrysis_lutea.AAC.5